MKINNFQQTDPYRTQLDRTADLKETVKQNVKTADNATAQPTGDRISLSPQAQLHATASRAASNAPELRQEKVDSIKAKVESGQYSIDSKDIAAKLLVEDGDQLLNG